MNKIVGESFENSKTCHGMAFVADAPLDLAEIVITGRYPEDGWAKNRESHEMVRVLRGVGSLTLRNSEVTGLVEGDVVHVLPGDWFAWDGDMTILIACSPASDPEKYEVKMDDQIKKEEAL
ncbi:MAG TPA: hypothetical protein PKD28_02230 [Candidatus Saccharibacteria bacterium]|nr:hypothetical protein [Candidatus Saccharibacteria bacterium]